MDQQLSELAKWYSNGKIFAYPTESVYGLGCDPQNENAVMDILALKERPIEKGLILIASEFSQIASYVQFDLLPSSTQSKILQSWPGPVTWLLPKSSQTPEWISGHSDLVAIRISAHPLVRNMCHVIGQSMVSTSANPAGLSPAKSDADVMQYFSKPIADGLVHLVKGELGNLATPSKIINSQTMEVIRT